MRTSRNARAVFLGGRVKRNTVVATFILGVLVSVPFQQAGAVPAVLPAAAVEEDERRVQHRLQLVELIGAGLEFALHIPQQRRRPAPPADDEIELRLPAIGDLITTVAGLLRLDFRLFLVLTAVGKFFRYFLLVVGLDWFQGWVE